MKKTIYLVLILLLFINCQAQKPLTSKNYLINNFKKSSVIKNTHYGISIRDIKTGKELVNEHSQSHLTPASNLKILYTLAAVDQYGKNFQYKTNLFLDGNIKNHTLEGNLIFQPHGDPTFGALGFNEDLDSLFNEIIQTIQKLGIKHINGKIKMELNGWRYPAAGSWPIEDIGNYYGTGAWDFNFRDNRLDIYLKRSTIPGTPTSISHTEPKIPGITYISKVTTTEANTGDESYVFAAPFTKTRYILGTIPAGKNPFKVKAGIPNPPLNFLKLLKQKLNNQIDIKGIEIDYKQKKYTQLIWEKKSPTLLEIAKITNDYSMNHYSEALGWLLIQGDKPANGYLKKEEINDFFKQKYGLQNIDLEDASGLAPDNILPPSELTQYIQLMCKKLGLSIVLDILPHGGEDGYAKYFLRASPLQNQVWVKSGSVSKVQNYSGIFKGNSGKYYAFSVMTNFFTSEHRPIIREIEELIEGFIKIY